MTVAACEAARHSAVGTRHYIFAEIEALGGQSLVRRSHDVCPRLHRVVGGVFQTLVVGVSVPARAHVIRRASAEVTVLDVTGGTGLAEGVKSADFGAASRTA